MSLYNNEELTVNETRDLLRAWRENNERKSEDVVELWKAVLEDNISQLGNEKHVILEQVIFASLDCHEYASANACLQLLSQEFPGSARVLRYDAMMMEALERYDKALEILDSLIKHDETNAAPRKRRIAIHKARGHTSLAIKELVDYLKKFMADVEAWQELCELYAGAGELSRAAFCAEELLLHQPHSHVFHQRLADIRYSMGGMDNMELAKSYYCQALKLNPNNMRALYGLFLVTNNLSAQYKTGGSASKRKEVWRLGQWAQQAITARHRDAGVAAPRLAPARASALHADAGAADPLQGMILALSINN